MQETHDSTPLHSSAAGSPKLHVSFEGGNFTRNCLCSHEVTAYSKAEGAPLGKKTLCNIQRASEKSAWFHESTDTFQKAFYQKKKKRQFDFQN